MPSLDPIDVALRVVAALDACQVPYTVGGSLASSVSGEPRASIDADILVQMRAVQVPGFLEALGDGFYADPDALRRAAESFGSANLIDRQSGIKVDIFFAGSALDHLQLERRRRVQLGTDPDRSLFMHSPEDILLQKLQWYRLGGEVSERQWRDVLAIFVVQGDRLDRSYLEATARQAGLVSLLHRASRDVDQS